MNKALKFNSKILVFAWICFAVSSLFSAFPEKAQSAGSVTSLSWKCATSGLTAKRGVSVTAVIAKPASWSSSFNWTLQRRVSGQGSFVNVANPILPSSSSVSDFGVPPGATYEYRAKQDIGAAVGFPNPDYTSARTITIPPNVCPDYTSPGSFMVTATPQCDGADPFVDLTWNSSENAGQYTISVNGGTPSPLQSGRSYKIENLENSTSYAYAVTAYAAQGYFLAPTVISGSVTTKNCEKPASFTLTVTPECEGIVSRNKLTWNESVGANSYEIKVGDTNLDLVGTRIAYHNNVISGEDYSYEVIAINSGSGLSTSAEQSGTAKDCTPSGQFILSVETICEEAVPANKLTWTTPEGESAISYEVYLVGNLSPLTSTKAREYLDKDISSGTTYNYFVKAISEGGATDSQQVSVKAGNCIVPSDFSIDVTASCSEDQQPIANISWGSANGAKSYALYRNNGEKIELVDIRLPNYPLTFTDNLSGQNEATYFSKAINDSPYVKNSNSVEIEILDCRKLEASITSGNESDNLEYFLGDIVPISIANDGPDAIELRSDQPFIIQDADGNVVFNPSDSETSGMLVADQSKTWNWNQQNSDGEQVPVGEYKAVITYYLGEEEKSITIPFKIIERPPVDESKVDPEFSLQFEGDDNTAPATLTGSIFSDCTEEIIWNWGDGTIVANTGIIESHTYNVAGNYTVTVHCGDAFSGQIITIKDAPFSGLDLDTSLDEDSLSGSNGENAEGDASAETSEDSSDTSSGSSGQLGSSGDLGSSSDNSDSLNDSDSSSRANFALSGGGASFSVTAKMPENCDQEITWDWGDGTVDQNSTREKTHTYTQAGVYTITGYCGDESMSKRITISGETELPDTGNAFFNFLSPIWNWVSKIF